jgi:Family of unknown function (DUF6193)
MSKKGAHAIACEGMPASKLQRAATHVRSHEFQRSGPRLRHVEWRPYAGTCQAGNRLYPELITAGGLANALQMALHEIGSSYTVFGRNVNVGVVCVRVEGEQRHCQAYIVEQRRLFVFDLWEQHARFVCATAGSLMDVAQRIHQWLASPCSAADVVAGLELVTVDDDGMVYDARDDVDRAWRELPSYADPSLAAFVREASEREKLRQLLPYGGGHCIGFSRCTQYPFTRDLPVVWPSGPGQFTVKMFGKVFGCGDAAYAADLVVALLPPNCGPAVSGPSAALGPLEQ